MYSDPTLFRMTYKVSGLAQFTRQGSWLRSLAIKLANLPVQSLRIPQTASAVDVVKGAVMVVRGTACQQVGPIDEVTLAYGEETDWHLRFRRARWKVAVVPATRVVHFGGGQSELILRGWQLVEDRKAILNYFIKHKPRWQVITMRCVIVLSHGVSGLLCLLIDRQRAGNHLQAARIGLFWNHHKESTSG